MWISSSWISSNWFPLFQTLGIVGALLFNAYSLFLNARIRKVDTLINITQQHRTIWLKFFDTPHLKRILDGKIDLKKHPVTDEEAMFVNLIILHLETLLTAVSKGIVPKPAGLDVDTKDFFSRPIPLDVWNQTKTIRDPETIRYVEGLIAKSPGKSHPQAF
jgi:hypothetical protein